MKNEGAIVASAAGRAGIIGNPTDGYGGCVISCTLAYRSYAELTCGGRELRLEIGEEHVTLQEPEDLRLGFERGLEKRTPADVARAVLRYFLEQGLPWPEPGFLLRTWTEVPLQAGLAGSTAITAALYGALSWFYEVKESPYRIAEAVRWIEHRIMGQTCGYQDQYMAVFGGVNFLDFTGKAAQRQDESEPYAAVEPLEGLVDLSKFVVIHTGVQHDSTSVHRPIRERWEQGEEAVVEGYREITRLARLGKRALLEGNWPELGRLMNANHAIQRDLGGSGEINEKYIDLALEAGAWGAKLAGAGQGGTLIVLHPEPEKLGRELVSAAGGELVQLGPGPGLRLAGPDDAKT